MSDKSAMPVSKALDFADEWTDGITFYPGSDGWRVVCATLAAEVRRLRHGGDKLPMSREQIEKEMGKCFQIGRAAHSTRENMIIFAEHILLIGTTELREENKRLRSGEFICKKCGLRKDGDNFFGEIPF